MGSCWVAPARHTVCHTRPTHWTSCWQNQWAHGLAGAFGFYCVISIKKCYRGEKEENEPMDVKRWALPLSPISKSTQTFKETHWQVLYYLSYSPHKQHFNIQQNLLLFVQEGNCCGGTAVGSHGQMNASTAQMFCHTNPCPMLSPRASRTQWCHTFLWLARQGGAHAAMAPSARAASLEQPAQHPGARPQHPAAPCPPQAAFSLRAHHHTEAWDVCSPAAAHSPGQQGCCPQSHRAEYSCQILSLPARHSEDSKS